MDHDELGRLNELPIACTLNASDGAARLARWQALSAGAQASVQRSDRELVVRYRLQDGVGEELEELVAAERECCSFADWELTQAQDHAILRIRSDAEGLAGIVGAVASG
jgi:hypothetical protein